MSSVSKSEVDALVNKSTGLVPVKMNVSEAGLGLRAGEVRGVDPETAYRMVNRDVNVPDPDNPRSMVAVKAATLVKPAAAAKVVEKKDA